MPPITRRYNRLRIRSLKFISAVDHGAQGPIANVALIKRAPAHDEIEAVCKVALASEPLGIVFGWCLASSLDGGQTEHIDLQDDAVVGDDELIKIAAAFMEEGGASDVMHDDSPDGKVLFMLPLTADVLKALRLKSDVHGLAIGMKPSPETFKAFQSGALNAFSIAGIGEREPVEPTKSASRLCPNCGAYPMTALGAAAAAAAAEKCWSCGEPMTPAGRSAAVPSTAPDAAGLTSVTYAGPGPGAPLGKALYIEGGVGKYLAELRDDADRVRIARLNPAAPWAAEWIAKGIEMDNQAEIAKQATDIEKQRAAVEITIEKSTTIVKSLVAKRDAALKAHDDYIAKVASDRKVTPHAALSALLDERDATYTKLYEDHDAAHDAVCRANEHILAPKMEFLTKQYDGVAAKMRDAEESFCLAHNVDPHVAPDRLMKISPTYRALAEKATALDTERHMARSQAQAASWKVFDQMATDAAKAQADRAEAQKRAAETPANKVFREHVERFAKARSLDYPSAVDRALREDDTARALYGLIESERRAS